MAKISDLSWNDLTSLRSYYAALIAECHDRNGIALITKLKTIPLHQAELERLDKYIQAKYQKVKDNSTKQN